MKSCALYHCRLMLAALPELISPLRLAQQGSHLQGGLRLTQMPRLLESLEQESSSDSERIVELNCQFDLDAVHRPCLEGHLRVPVKLLCQRCLQPFEYVLEVRSRLLLLKPGKTEPEEMPEGWETLELDDSETLSLAAWAEDELILALPLVALHAGHCPDNEYQFSAKDAVESEPDTATEDKQNPFAVLAALKNKQD